MLKGSRLWSDLKEMSKALMFGGLIREWMEDELNIVLTNYKEYAHHMTQTED